MTVLPVILGSLSGPRADQATLDRLRDGMPGVTLFRYYENLVDAHQVRALTDALHAATPRGTALVAIDQEGGQFQSLTGIVTDFPGAMAIAATGDVELARDVGRAMGRELRALGVTVNYAPVCDLLAHATDHALSIRTFGGRADLAAACAAAMIDGLQSVGVAATAKHFPGSGGAREDTHFARTVIERTRAQFDAEELVPFRSAIGADVKLVMSSHAGMPGLNDGSTAPATRSRQILTELLRDELGFTGVVTTDAIDMAAMGAGDQASVTECADAVLAGADLLLTTPRTDIAGLVRSLGEALGDPAADVLERSRGRVDSLRRWLASFGVPDTGVVACGDHAALAADVARRSITEVRAAGGPLHGHVVVIEAAARNLTLADTTNEGAASLGVALAATGPAAQHVVAHRPTEAETSAVVAAAVGRDVCVALTAATTEPAQLDLARRLADVAASLTICLVRNPLDAATLGDLDARILCSYGQTAPSMAALAAAVRGELAPTGVLPVDLDVERGAP